MPSIRATRDSLSDQLSVAGFRVQTGDHEWYEVALATDASLFQYEKRGERRHTNFYSSRAEGPLRATGREVMYFAPADVIERFAGQDQLFYGLATFRDENRSDPRIVRLPSANSPWIALEEMSNRPSRRMARMPEPRSRRNGNGYSGPGPEALVWAGDMVRPGSEDVVPAPDGAAPTNGAPANGDGVATAPGMNTNGNANQNGGAVAEVEYDDGFGPLPTDSPPTNGDAVAAALSNQIPLDPGAGGQSIGTSALAVGDIILSTTNEFISEQIRNVTGAPVSHSMLYVGDGMVVEAIAGGVTNRPLSEAIASATVAVAFRYPDLTTEQAQQIRDFAGEQIGESYNYWGIVRQAGFILDRRVWCEGRSGDAYDRCVNHVGRVNLGTGSNDSWFCSQLVLAAYTHAGVPLTSTPPHWGTPGDIADLRLTHNLGYVGHLKAPPIGSSQALQAGFGRAYSADPMELAGRFGAPMVEQVQRLRGEGVSDSDLASFLIELQASDAPATQAGLRATPPRYAEVMGRGGVEIHLPGGTVLDGWQSDLLLAAISLAGSPFAVSAIIAVTDKFNVTVGIGPSISGGLGVGGGFGAGIVFSPGRVVGFYGSRSAVAGAIASLSATMQVTIVRGGIGNFTGTAYAVTGAGGEGIVGSVSVLFDSNRQFLGISAEAGVGVGIPFEAYEQAQQNYATSQALAHDRAGQFAHAHSANGDPLVLAERLGPETVSEVRRLRGEGVSDADLSSFLTQLTSPDSAPAIQAALMAMPAKHARVFGRDGTEIQMPGASIVEGWEGRILATAASVAFGGLGAAMALNAIFEATNRLNVTVGVGPAISGGVEVGGSLGVGIVIAPGHRIGFYGSVSSVVGLIDSISATLQVTIIKGGINNFTGTAYVVTAGGGEGIVGSVSLIFKPSGEFLGISVEVGVGVGIPFELYGSVQETHSTSQALAHHRHAPAALGADESFDINWNGVELVPQLNSFSCWAAAAAMVVGWKERISINPTEIASGTGVWGAYKSGLFPRDHTQIASAWGLTTEGPQSYSIEGFRTMLENNGPLWVGVAVPSGHAIAVTGLFGDGTPGGTSVRYNDPWPPNVGAENQTQSWMDFTREYENRVTTNGPGNVNIQIMHAGGTDGRTIGATAMSYSIALAFQPVLQEDVDRMRDIFLANVNAGSPQSCISIMNSAMRGMFGSRLQNPNGSNKSLGSTVQDTMAALQGYGLADSETVFEYNNASGNLTRGVTRPDHLQTSIEDWLNSEAEANAMSTWYVFGLSIMDGYHSVVIALQFSGTGDPLTKMYWADQIYSGWDDVTGMLDARITSLTQRWWDGQPANRKAKTRATVWPLNA